MRFLSDIALPLACLSAALALLLYQAKRRHAYRDDVRPCWLAIVALLALAASRVADLTLSSAPGSNGLQTLGAIALGLAVAAGFAIWGLLPSMLASPSPNALLKTTLDLRGVVARGAAEMELLGEAKAALEKTVADRTRELNEANQRFAKALENTGIAMAQQDVDLRSLLQLLTHRTKNLLAVIMGIARQSRASTMDVDIFVARFNGRIRALAIAHDLLLNARWRDVNLWKLIDCVWRNIAPRAIDHVTLTGDDVFIGPECAQNLALAIHEMAANAIQHGRLLEADGKVHISWAPAVENETAGIELLWRETGCSSTAPSPFTGFGKSFVLVLLPRATGGRSDFCWTTDGLSWRLWLPVHHSVSKKDAA